MTKNSKDNKTIFVPAGLFTDMELRYFEKEILDNKHITEHQASKFFEKFPRFLSIGGYKQLKKEVAIYKPDNEDFYRVDFFRLKYGEDFWDIIELKSPQKPIAVKRSNHWKFSSFVESGIHQSENYKDLLDDSYTRSELKKRTGIISFKPKILLVAGRYPESSISPRELKILKNRVNSVDIVTYDDLYRFARDFYKSSLTVVPIFIEPDSELSDIIQNELENHTDEISQTGLKARIQRIFSKSSIRGIFSRDLSSVIISISFVEGNTCTIYEYNVKTKHFNNLMQRIGMNDYFSQYSTIKNTLAGHFILRVENKNIKALIEDLGGAESVTKHMPHPLNTLT